MENKAPENERKKIEVWTALREPWEAYLWWFKSKLNAKNDFLMNCKGRHPGPNLCLRIILFFLLQYFALPQARLILKPFLLYKPIKTIINYLHTMFLNLADIRPEKHIAVYKLQIGWLHV